MKLGQILWWLLVEGEGASIHWKWEQYIVRTIRKGVVYATWKNSSTWGKRSKKHGDFGWLIPTNPSFTDVINEHSCQQTTKLKTINHELKFLKGEREWYSPEETEILIRKLNAMKKRLKK
tara:strand:- start:1631 stop:1990 length:360 start_codon:yes stop_codon:yes gene_type:complete